MDIERMRREAEAPVRAGAGDIDAVSADLAAASEGQVLRLMELYNFQLLSKDPGRAVGRYAGEEVSRAGKKVQWAVPSRSVPVEVLEPSELYADDETLNPDSLKVRLGSAEESFGELGEGSIVQFPRYGFVRVDGPGRCVLAHS